jgi:hypothetical protein
MIEKVCRKWFSDEGFCYYATKREKERGAEEDGRVAVIVIWHSSQRGI